MIQEFRGLEDVVTRRRIPARVPLYEHFVDDPIVCEVMNYDFSTLDFSTQEGQLEAWKKRIEFYRQMGYDYIPVELPIHFAARPSHQTQHEKVADKVKRSWVDEHEGPVKGWDDLENPDFWPDVEHAFDYDLFDAIGQMLPEGMRITGGASGGPFEHASFLMGLENLCIGLAEDPDMIHCLFDKIGNTLVGVAKRLSALDSVGIYRFGDDLGYKCATMLSPSTLREYVFPWQKRVVEAVHANGKPFLLHSCGQLEAVMDDLIDDVGIDAKHSFEDNILPVTEAKKRWGNRIAILGGIDVDFLCRSTPDAIREHTRRVLEVCWEGGGYAAGSGNTITSYMPAENYLAMLDGVRQFNGI